MPITDLTPTAGLQQGSTRTVTATFTTSAGGAATVAAADVTLTLTDPAGASEALTADDLSVASNVVSTAAEYAFDAGGTWRWTWSWTDAGVTITQEALAFVTPKTTGAP